MLHNIVHPLNGIQQDSTVIRHVPFYRSRASPKRLVGAVELTEPDWQVCTSSVGPIKS